MLLHQHDDQWALDGQLTKLSYGRSPADNLEPLEPPAPRPRALAAVDRPLPPSIRIRN